MSAQPTGSKWLRALPGRVGSADPQSARNLADSKNSGSSIYASRIRVLSGGSKRQSAQPTGGSKRQSAQPTGGSKWQSAQPTGGS